LPAATPRQHARRMFFPLFPVYGLPATAPPVGNRLTAMAWFNHFRQHGIGAEVANSRSEGCFQQHIQFSAGRRPVDSELVM